MQEFNKRFKHFEFDDEIIYYYIKDIGAIREKYGKEMVSAYMVAFVDGNENDYEVFQVYDEKLKVDYAMPCDAKRWYEHYLKNK